MRAGGLLIFALIPLSYWIAALILRRRKQPVPCPWPTADYCPRTVALLTGEEEIRPVRKGMGGRPNKADGPVTNGFIARCHRKACSR